MRLKNRLSVIFSIVFIDFLGLSFILPLYPDIADRFGLSATAITLLAAAYALMQFIFSPILGRISDRIGRKPVLAITSLGTAASFVFFGLATSVPLLFLSRILNGIFGSSAAVAQAYIADVTGKDERTEGMGAVGAALGLGLIFGPALSAFLGGYGYSGPALGAAAITLLNSIFILFFLKESLPKELRRRSGQFKLFDFGAKDFIEVLKHPLMGRILITYFISTLALALIQNIAVLFAEERFHLTLQENGYFFAVVGLAMVLTQGFLVGRLEKNIGESAVLVLGTLFLLMGYFLTPLIEQVGIIVVAAGLVALGAGLYLPAVNSLISKNASSREQGEIFGMVHSLIGLALIVGPVLGGILFDVLGSGSPFFVAGILTIFSLYFSLKVFNRLRQVEKRKFFWHR
ncbi:MAG: MFS transporter [Patescibacteria group bacterium]